MMRTTSALTEDTSSPARKTGVILSQTLCSILQCFPQDLREGRIIGGGYLACVQAYMYMYMYVHVLPW